MRHRIGEFLSAVLASSSVLLLQGLSACGNSDPGSASAAGSGGNAPAGSATGGSSGSSSGSAGNPAGGTSPGAGAGGTGNGGAAAGGGGADTAFPLHVPTRRHIAAGNLVTCATGASAVSCWGGKNTTLSQRLTGADQDLALGASAFAQVICGIASDGTTTCADSEGDVTVDSVSTCLPKTPLADVSFDRKLGYTAVVSQSGQAQVFGKLSCGPGTVPTGLSGIKRIVSADTHTCALDAQGKAYCWVSNAPDTVDSVLADQFVDIAAGSVTACGINMAGKVRCWDTSGKENLSPSGFAAEVSGAADSPPVVQLASDGSARNLCALFNDGKVICSHDFDMDVSTTFQLAATERVTEIAVGDSHVCGVRSDGSVLCLPFGCTDCATAITPPTGFAVTR